MTLAGERILTDAGTTLEEAVNDFGAFVCPKYLVANVMHRTDRYSHADCERIKKQVHEIDDLLYKFSLEKL